MPSHLYANYDATGNQIRDEDNSYLRKALLAADRTTTLEDNGRVLGNNTASNLSFVIAANTTPDGIVFQQLSSGTVTVSAGSGVTFIGSTLATATAGQIISVIPTPLTNTFIVKVS